MTQINYVDRFTVNEWVEKLLVMGELGFAESNEPLDEAADKLQKWQHGSCQYNLTGRLLWTWQTEQGVLLSISDDGTIFQSLSPITQPKSDCQDLK